MLSKIIALSVLLAATPAMAGPIALLEAEARRVEQGEIVTRVQGGEEAIKSVTSVGRVRHPAGDVFLLMTDFKNYPRIYNALESARVEHADGALAHYRVRAPWPLPGRAVSVATTFSPDAHAFTWRRVGGDIRAYQGELVAVPAGDDACTVFYTAKVDPGFDWIPSWFVNWGQQKVLPSIVQAIRDTLGKRRGPYWEAGVNRPAFSREPAN